ncbi:hypothetical protein RhiJN_04166 [Ceratobasidium sp. AG-Ba]|nr:hypothetical protein RhiJN_04166 [Ceratobasidium sp. AG-Ba]QRW05055.1 hypothetical protein RhiLY_04054 [Ceratobasidium sp. AG-Ba]
MHPKPPVPRRNTLTKPSPATMPAALYPPQMTLAGPNYISAASAAPTPPKSNMQQAPNPGAAQRPYLAAEMTMMQDALKMAALKTAETIRYMSTARRVHDVSQVRGPPAAVTNELHKQLARYDQLCDIVETRLVRAHAALSIRLARERAANPQLAHSSQPIQIDSPMSDDVPLSLSNNASSAPAPQTIQYVAPPKSRGLSSLAAQRPPNALPDPARIITPVTLASNANIMSSLDSIPSHHAVVPELLNALRRQEQEQARNALHQPQAQDVSSIDMFGAAASSMGDLFMDGTNPTGVDLDINSAVAAIDTSVGGMDPVSAIHSAVPDIHSAVPDIHSAVPDMDSAVAELDSAVAEMAAAAESDALFGDLPGDGGEQFPGDGPDPFGSVSGTGEDQAKAQDLLANLDAGESSGMDLEMNMDLMGMSGLGIGAGGTGTGDEGDMSGINIDDANMGLGDMGMGDGGIDGIDAIWSSMDYFDAMGAGIADGIDIKTEPE